MKKLLLTSLAAVLFLPTLTQAATFKSGEEVYIDQRISDDLYATGGMMSFTQGINGDLIAAGGRLNLEGPVSQDLMAGGGEINISAEVDDDVRVVGGSIRIDSIIKGDLMAAAGDIALADSNFVGGDVNIAAGNLVLDGIVNGDLKLAGGAVYFNADVKGDVTLVHYDKITFGPRARIQGSLRYRAPEALELPRQVVRGSVVFEKTETSQVKQNLPAVMAGFSVYSLLATLFFGLFFLWLCRFYIMHTTEHAYDNPLKGLGVGFLVLILSPIAVIVLLITTIGMPVALTLLALWLIYLYMAKIMAAMLIGFKIVKVNDKSSFSRMFGSFALGALIYTLVGMVPIVGWVINLILVLLALGSMTLYEFELFYQLRKKKIV